MTRKRRIREAAAIAIALSIHAAAVAGVLYDRSLPEPATHQGTGGVTMIVAATAAGAMAGSGAASADSEKPATERPLETKREETTPPRTAEPAPEPELPTAQLRPDAQTALRSQELDIERHTWLKQVVRAPLKKIAPPPAAKPVPQPKRKPDPPKKTAQKPLPAPPADLPTQPQPQAKVPAQTQVGAETTPRARSTGPDSDSTSSAAIGGDQGNARRTQVAVSGGGEISAHGDYLAAVRNWLHEHKRYPRRARLRMLQGDATIGFVLDRAGRVVSYKLQKSSGHEVLDNEVRAMVRRASPMPPFPPGLAREKMNFSVPVRFDMR